MIEDGIFWNPFLQFVIILRNGSLQEQWRSSWGLKDSENFPTKLGWLKRQMKAQVDSERLSRRFSRLWSDGALLYRAATRQTCSRNITFMRRKPFHLTKPNVYLKNKSWRRMRLKQNFLITISKDVWRDKSKKKKNTPLKLLISWYVENFPGRAKKKLEHQPDL